MKTNKGKIRQFNLWVVFFSLIYIALVVKFITIAQYQSDVFFSTYSVVITLYILSRFILAYYNDGRPRRFDRTYIPTITFGVPSKNEEDGIYGTIMGIAAIDYDADKFNIIAVNDGSTDGTLARMRLAQEDAMKLHGVTVDIIDWTINRGKRHGMAECIKRSDREIMVFIDSDSLIEPQSTKELVKYFADPKIGAVTAHGYVSNATTNVLTRMQAVKYYISFRAYKSAESLFGCVTCCSGCGAAYRRASLMRIVDKWCRQTFLGALCTFGDDRSLTNLVLKEGFNAIYAPEAPVHTKVPDSLRIYMKQQMRWKKSWIRESLRASTFMWRRNIIAAISFYIGLVLPFIAPLVVLRAIIFYPSFTHHLPIFYIFGIGLMGMIYGLYYRIHTRRSDWLVGTIFTLLFGVILIAQFPFAIANIRDGRWGTR